MKTTKDLLKWFTECNVWIDPYNIVWHWQDGTLWYIASDQPNLSELPNTNAGRVDVVRTHADDGTAYTYFEPHAEIMIEDAPVAIRNRYSAWRPATKQVHKKRLTEVFYLAHTATCAKQGFQLGGLAASLSGGLSKNEIERCRDVAAKRYAKEGEHDTLGLLKAILSGNVSSCKSYLEEHCYEVDANFPLLHVATISGFSKIVRALISGGAEVNKTDSRSMPALHYASYSAIDDPIMLVTSLIESGADVDAITDEKLTPILIAAMHGKTEIARLLVDAGADIEALTEYGETPLSVALEQNHPEFVALMISVGAELNLTNRFGVTLLTHAKKKGYLEIAEMLAKAGALDTV